ncbi:uncharacterized protein F4822DRAFT_54434 [Hypoxylon trugodes]|uniref:uncharacterized protein n=1 Tax=Hypoxylon trugodes TaxID=326681 RepID=UPI0021991905|nr:uncharacterized protein F4822DRAFT_54434 [Hypoxylon trugodes]KAI1383890.1 hypothetical protein F4822DRAFT_54434 [Hypoxylon trugodes]
MVHELGSKPGYGKTVLSQLVIDDLKSEYETFGPLDAPHRPTLFYHFNSELFSYCTTTHALRAVLLQLVHAIRREDDMLDGLSVLIDSESSGQVSGSNEEVKEALHFLLTRVGGATLVFDAIDECSDASLFLETIYNLCYEMGTKALLLTRPNLSLPRVFKSFISLDLKDWQNAEDINSFLAPEIQCLRADGLLGEDTGCDEICSLLTTRSQGMFLWAQLMVTYLNCKVLSPKERVEAIFIVEVVEGLEKLYEKILTPSVALSLRNRPRSAGCFNSYVFPKGHSAHRSSKLYLRLNLDLIVDFGSVLPNLSGGLVEVDNRGSVMFIHSSFREFLTNPTLSGKSGFMVDISRAHINTSALLLSYLIYSTPQGPKLRSNPRMRHNGTLNFLEKEFPLMAHAAIFWVDHASQGISKTNDRCTNAPDEEESNFYSMLDKMLALRTSITGWIEISWFYDCEPSVKRLVKRLTERTVHSYSQGDPKALYITVVSKLSEFSRDLDLLSSEWGHELRGNPSAIWGPNITAFNKSPFWYGTQETIVSSLVPNSIEDKSKPRELVLMSKSATGGISFLSVPSLGIVSITPSSDYMSYLDNLANSENRNAQRYIPNSRLELARWKESVSQGCEARYVIKLIDSGQTLWDVKFDVPSENISSILDTSWHMRTFDRFDFPVAISPTLRQAVVGRTLLTIDEGEPTTSNHIVEGRSPNTAKQDLRVNAPIRTGSLRISDQIYFSSNGEAIAISTRKIHERHYDVQKRDIEIWRGDISRLAFTFKGRVTASALCTLNDRTSQPLFMFHPSLELIIFPQDYVLCLWPYNQLDAPLLTMTLTKSIIPVDIDSNSILKYIFAEMLPLENDNSSSFDTYRPCVHPSIIGMDSAILTESMSFMDISAFIERAIAALSIPEVASNDNTTPRSPDTLNIRGAIRSSSEVILKQENGGRQSVIWKPGGNSSDRFHITPLPKLNMNEEGSINLLPLNTDQRQLTLVWNKEKQKTYSFLDRQSRHLPSILKRRLDSLDSRGLCNTEDDVNREGTSSQLQGSSTKRIKLTNE